MQIQLTISESPVLPASLLQAFAEKASRDGKTPDERLAELITNEVNSPELTKTSKKSKA